MLNRDDTWSSSRQDQEDNQNKADLGKRGEDAKAKPSHLEDELCFAVYSTQKLYNRFYSIVLKRYGLTYVQYATMLVLWEEWRPMMVKALGERLKLDSGTLTSLLNRLEKQGWVVRNRNFEDGRCMMVELMPKALSL